MSVLTDLYNNDNDNDDDNIIYFFCLKKGFNSTKKV